MLVCVDFDWYHLNRYKHRERAICVKEEVATWTKGGNADEKKKKRRWW